MTTRSFPVKLEPFKFAEQRKLIDATLAIDYLSRFALELNSNKGEIHCKIKGMKDVETRVRALEVSLSGEVELICQGCTEPFMFQLQREAVLYPVYSEEQMKSVPDDGEPVLVEETGSGVNLDLKSAIEDELILSLPLIPLYGDCVELEAYQVGELPEITAEEEAQENPFGALKNLKLD